MKFLVMSCLFGLALAGQVPVFRYYTAISLPQSEARHGFNERDGSGYRWGYRFPGQVHTETRDEGGNVRGTFGYLDAHGISNIWKYRSDQGTGFTAEIELRQPNKNVPQSAQRPVEEPAPIFYSLEDKSKREEFYNHFAISPKLINAVESQQVIAAGSSPFSKTPQFYINREQVEEAGSVSALAAKFGAIPVAAVHDVQSRPGYASHSSSSPVLNHFDGVYTIEIPEPVV
ncbi:uncharacterized protein [Palaemon carinicauda]|uniref:uncharacterized protein isoform X2 n=1 Tax=Palaemon carinicauda TaxID=392227 RepID=UPI0035B5B79A